MSPIETLEPQSSNSETQEITTENQAILQDAITALKNYKIRQEYDSEDLRKLLGYIYKLNDEEAIKNSLEYAHITMPDEKADTNQDFEQVVTELENIYRSMKDSDDGHTNDDNIAQIGEKLDNLIAFVQALEYYESLSLYQK